MTPNERLLVQRQIASILDSPSLYMGGPSQNSKRKADLVLRSLERSKRLTPTTCEHGGWESYELHGAFCPDCGMLLDKGRMSTP